MSKITRYICITIVFLCLIIIGTLLDIYFDMKNLVVLFTKFSIIALCIGIVKKLNITKEKGKISKGDIAISLVPALFSMLLIFGPINKIPDVYSVIIGVLGVLATAIWEELHYRMIGVEVFKGEKEKLTYKEVILLSLLFGFSHAINIVLKPQEILIELFRIILSTASASLFLALYIKTKRIELSILSHFLLNYITLFFKTFSTSYNYLGYIAYDVIYYISVISYFVIAYMIFKKYNLVK